MERVSGFSIDESADTSTVPLEIVATTFLLVVPPTSIISAVITSLVLPRVFFIRRIFLLFPFRSMIFVIS